MRFEWNEDKNAINQRKHGISFETASLVFEDPNRLLFVERIEEGPDGAMQSVVHTYAEEEAEAVVRAFSSRRVTRHERNLC